ncbi:histidine--tRNA ligase [soil metagenome]
MSKISKLSAVKGMNDVLPADAALWEYFEDAVRRLMASYAYTQIRTPILEPTPLFHRGIGEVTDIVEKELYSFTDALNGDPLSLRPENTASVCRAVLEHHLTYDGGKRLWYIGPMFRHERPQRGRYRQFHQFGAEAIGFAGPDVDAELILMTARLWETLELPPLTLKLNTLGNREERARHRVELIAYLEANVDALDADAKRRMHSAPLRVLDSKNPQVREVVAGAPRLIDQLGPDSRAHFEQLQRLLKLRGQAFEVDHHLVRGLDYYGLTVFEWVTDALGAQSAVCGGGRYDGLIELLGGDPTPACGFAIGIERVLELIKLGGFESLRHTDVYVVHSGTGAVEVAMQVGEQLRDNGFDVAMNAGDGSFKSQMKRADASGATFAVIIGEDELRAGDVTLKTLRDPHADPEAGARSGGAQQRVPIAELSDRLVEAFGVDDHGHDHGHDHVH